MSSGWRAGEPPPPGFRVTKILNIDTMQEELVLERALEKEEGEEEEQQQGEQQEQKEEEEDEDGGDEKEGGEEKKRKLEEKPKKKKKEKKAKTHMANHDSKLPKNREVVDMDSVMRGELGQFARSGWAGQELRAALTK